MANRICNHSTIVPSKQRFGKRFNFESDSFEIFSTDLDEHLLNLELLFSKNTVSLSATEPNLRTRFSQSAGRQNYPGSVECPGTELDFEIDVRWI